MVLPRISWLLLFTVGCGQVLTVDPDWPDAAPAQGGDAEPPSQDTGPTMDDAGSRPDARIDADAALPDTGPADTGLPDAGPPDTGPTDTGPQDAGPTDTGSPDGGVSYALTINVVGPGRVVSSSPAIDCDSACVIPAPANTNIELAAVPVGDSRLVDWSMPCTGEGDTCSVSLGQDTVIDAEFELRPPLVTNGQPADLVLGQPDFTTVNHVSASRYSFDFPTRCEVEGNRLWVTDEQNHRVLQWDALPVFNQAGADVVIGQSSFAANAGAVGADSLDLPGDVESSGARLFVFDFSRILAFDPVPSGSGAAASQVFGQTDFTSSMSGASASRFGGTGIHVSGGHLFLADGLNNRVLIWNAIPSSSGLHSADVVLGQTIFTAGAAASPPTSSSFWAPMDVFYSAESDTLVVADMLNNRVLIWNSLPTTNNQPADVVVGQTSFGVKQPNAGSPTPNQIGLAQPRSVAIAHGALFVADSTNERVLIWRPIPTLSGQTASWVIGASTFTDQGGTPSATTIGNPFGLCVGGDSLYVSNSNWDRVTRFQLAP